MFRSAWWLAGGAAALAASAVLFAWAAARRRQVSAALGRAQTLARVTEDAALSRRWRSGLRLSALALVFAALAGPQWGVELVETRGAARQVVVAVDVSLSMTTPDVQPNRLERAKAALSLLLEQLRGDRVGVVAFAGDAQVVCPLTADVDAAKQLLGGLEVGAVATPGTAVGTAIRTAAAMLGRYPGGKSVVLLTDGEDHHSDPLGAAKEAAGSGVKVYTVGIGTPEGEPIPAEGGGYKKDSKGATVVSRLGEEALTKIAEITGGGYYRTSPGEDEIPEIAARIKAGEAANGLAGTAARWRNRYEWPLGLAFLLLLIETALPLAALVRRNRSAAVLAFILLAAAAPARSALFEGALREANRKYAAEKYDDALQAYGEVSGKNPSDPRPVFNAGDALYRLDRDSDAAGAFGSIVGRRDVPAPLRAAALYNLGNSLYRGGDYGGAVDAYRGALALSPGDADARRNLVVALNRRKNPPPPKKKDNKDQNKNDQKNQDKSDKSNRGDQGKTRPQDTMTKEDAERVMRTVAEREKSTQKQAPAAAYGRKQPPRPPSGEDW